MMAQQTQGFPTNKNNGGRAEVDLSAFKIGGLIIAQIVAAAGFGFALRSVFSDGSFFSIGIAVGAGIIYLAFLVTGVFFIKSFLIQALGIVWEIVGILAPFYGGSLAPLLGAGGISFLLLILGIHSGREAVAQSLTIRVWQAGRAVLPKAILGVSILIGGVYYDISYKAISQNELPLSESSFSKILRPLEAPVRQFFPDYDSGISFHEFAVKTAERQVNQNKEFTLLPKGVKDELVRQSVNQLEDKIEDMSGARPNPDSSMTETVYDLSKAKVASLAEKGKSALSLVIVALLILLVLGFTWPIRIIAIMISFLLYHVLMAVGFARLASEERNREIIVVE